MSGRGLLPSHDGKPRRRDTTSDGGSLYMVIQKNRKWKKSTMRVQFLGTDSTEVNTTDVNTIKDDVRKCAVKLEKYANIKFEFPDDMALEVSQGDLQISFEENGKCVTEMNTVPRTINLPPRELIDSQGGPKAYILHELLHALGFLHEHGHPEANIPWDKEAVYQCYGKKWSRKVIHDNVLRVYSTDTVHTSQYDPYSIMAYDIQPDLRLDGQSIPWMGTLSQTDKMFIGIMYP